MLGLASASLTFAAPVDVIRECASSASASLTGFDKLAAACPELEAAITSTGMDRLLPAQWRAHMTVAQLGDLAELAARYAGQIDHVSPATASLDGILRRLKPAPVEAKTWWGALQDWWRDWLARSDSALAKWLREMSGRVRVSQGLLSWVAYGLAAIIAIVLAIVGLREFRQWQERRRIAAAEKKSERPRVIGMVPPGMLEPENSAEERLSLVLRALVSRLLDTGRLKTERSLTHRELASRSRFDDEQQRSAFAAVTAVAEAMVYGPRGTAQPAIPQAIEQGETLLAQIRPVVP